MSTEVTRSTGNGLVSLTEKIKYAEHLAQSGLLPKAYQRQPANVLLAMEYGDALGVHQMTAINEINVISGKPAMSASLMQSLARAAGHKVRVSGDAERAVCTIIRKDDPEYEHVSEWTKAKAESSGLWGRGHWQKDPSLMLKWRAISECVRLACSEVLGGLKYTPEEVTEFTSPEWRSQSAQPSQEAPQHHQGTEPQPGPAEPVETNDRPTQKPDVVEQRLREVWNDPAGLKRAVDFLSREGHPRLEDARHRLEELTATAPSQGDDVEDAEIVEDEKETTNA